MEKKKTKLTISGNPKKSIDSIDLAISKNEADELIMSAREKIYKDWVMKYGKKKNKINYFWRSKEINR